MLALPNDGLHTLQSRRRHDVAIAQIMPVIRHLTRIRLSVVDELNKSPIGKLPVVSNASSIAMSDDAGFLIS